MAGNNNTGQGGSPINNNAGQPKQSGLSWSTPAQPSSANAAKTPAVQPASTVQKSATPPKQQQPASAVKSASMDNKKFLKLLAGGVVVGALLAWVWVAWAPGSSAPGTGTASVNDAASTSSSEPVNTDAAGAVPSSTTGSTADLSIPSPQDAGLEVTVAHVSVSQPTWVVVYESRGGQPGNALGAALMFPESKNGTVKLLRATQSGQTYFVGQSIDNGDRVFSLQEDERVRDVQGNLDWATFKTR